MGKSDFEAITHCRDDDYFSQSSGVGRVPSAETLRQRLDEVAPTLRRLEDAGSVEFLKRATVTTTPLDTGHIPPDCDVFPMGNSRTKKQRESRIYNGEDGNAPMAACLGAEGRCLELELREGSQHSQNGFIPFMEKVIERARSLTSRKIHMRLDSATDALDTRVTVAGKGNRSYIIKGNALREDQFGWGGADFQRGQGHGSPGTGKGLGCSPFISSGSTRGRPTDSKGLLSLLLLIKSGLNEEIT